jgi:hypothetical protein
VGSPLVLGRRELGMGRVVSLWAVLVLLLNIILQTTIAAIVVHSMGDPTFAARVIEDLWYASQPRFASARSMNMQFASSWHVCSVRQPMRPLV